MRCFVILMLCLSLLIGCSYADEVTTKDVVDQISNVAQSDDPNV